MIDKDAVFRKIATMFRPCEREFFDYDPAETICGPNDRAMVGYDTYFPKKWLVEDFGFTEEEAEFFIKAVREENSNAKDT